VRAPATKIGVRRPFPSQGAGPLPESNRSSGTHDDSICAPPEPSLAHLSCRPSRGAGRSPNQTEAPVRTMTPSALPRNPACHTSPAVRLRSSLSTAAVVLWVAALMILYNGGIAVGYLNHTALLPVVRRILNPDYLPRDFGIALRLYHHRIFAQVVAVGSGILGEDGAIIALTLVGMVLMAACLLYLSRSLGLSLAGYATAGVLLALQAAETGRGLEANRFLGNDHIMPPTFAHALILLAVSLLIKGQCRAASFAAGLILLMHTQIGVLFVLILLPLLFTRLRGRPPRESLICLALLAAPLLPLLPQISQMARHGAADVSGLIDYFRFRQPHHFAFRADRMVLVVCFFLVQLCTLAWLNRRRHPGAEAVRCLASLSALILVSSGLHYLDYHLLKWGPIARMQFLRLSPLVTVFGMLCVVLCLQVGAGWVCCRRPELDLRRMGHLWLAGLVLATSAFAYADEVHRPGYALIRKHREESSPWADICRHIRESTNSDTVFLTPPGNEGFTYLSERSTVAEFKISPDGGMCLKEWYERLRDLAGGALPEGTGFENEHSLNEAYARLGPEALIALAAKYGARMAVLPSDSPVPFEPIYSNPAYRVVRIPVEPAERPAGQS